MSTFRIGQSRARRALRVAGSVALLALAGCNDGKQRADLLEQENADLRNRNEQLEAALNEAESQRALLDEEINRLRNQPASASPGGTGFEGIAGVNASALAGGGAILDMAGDVLFDSGRVVLKSSARSTLNSIADVIKSRYGTNTIRIEGHTDTDPIRRSQWKTNERLGAERALAVEEYLAGRGVNKDRMYIASFGPSNPKGSKRESRRVEIIILGN